MWVCRCVRARAVCALRPVGSWGVVPTRLTQPVSFLFVFAILARPCRRRRSLQTLRRVQKPTKWYAQVEKWSKRFLFWVEHFLVFFFSSSSSFSPLSLSLPSVAQDAAKIMAKDLVRTRRYVKRFIMMKAQIQAVSLKIQVLRMEGPAHTHTASCGAWGVCRH